MHEGAIALLKFQNDILSRLKTDFKHVFYVR